MSRSTLVNRLFRVLNSTVIIVLPFSINSKLKTFTFQKRETVQPVKSTGIQKVHKNKQCIRLQHVQECDLQFHKFYSIENFHIHHSAMCIFLEFLCQLIKMVRCGGTALVFFNQRMTNFLLPIQIESTK